MTELHVDTQSDAWVAVVRGLLGAPVVAPRGLRVREMADRVSVVIDRPHAGFVAASGRRLNHSISAIEGTSLVGQVSVPELITDRVGAFAPYANDGIFWGAYGPRVAGDVGQTVDLLKRDPDSRQAVITIFDSDRDLGRQDVKDVPCTVAIQFFLRDGLAPSYIREYVPHVDGGLVDVTPLVPTPPKLLHMWVVMRSNDAWLGLPYDLGQFSILQMAVAQALRAEIGTYTHSVGSMHLYERNWEDAALVELPTTEAVGHSFGGPGDIASTARRARRILLGDGLELDAPSPLESWLTARIDHA